MSSTNGEESLLDDIREVNHDEDSSRLSSIRTRGTGVPGTIFLIVNATLGAGLLNFPLAFDQSGGIASAIIIQLILLIFITAALIILAASSDMTNTSSMQDTLAELCGQKTLFLCAFCVTIYSFGCCLTFIIIIGDQFDRLLATFYGMDYCQYWFLTRNFVTSLSCLIFILPLSFFKRLDILSYASSIGCITIIYVAWLVVYESVNAEDYPKPTQTWPKDVFQALQIIPIICFAYQSHMTAIPTYACMKDRNISKFSLSIVISMCICFIVYTIVGIYGYRTFGSGNIPGDILQGYGDKSMTLAIAMIALVIKNFSTYPIVLYCGRNSLLASLLTAILVPDISPVINLLGTLSATFIFIFPGICLIQSVLRRDPSLYLNKSRFLILVAIITTALGGFSAGFMLVQASNDIFAYSTEKSLVTKMNMQLGASLCN